MNLNKLFLRWIAVFGIAMVFAVSGWGDTVPNDNCTKQEPISELNGISTTTTHTESGTTSASDIADYYSFTPGVAGTLDLHFTTTGGSVRLFVSTSSCGSGEIGNGQTDYTGSFTVAATETVYIRVQRNQPRTYNLAMTFTPSGSSISCTTLRDLAALTSSNRTYTNASHYNDNAWNVGPSSTGGTLARAYHFTVNGPGTVDIDLTRIDNNQAKFSVAQGSCPNTLQDLTSSTLTFTAAGDFYVYIYYVSGSNQNIEHQLDVVFTPPVAQTPPVMGNVPNQNATVGTAFSLNIASYVTQTNGDAITGYALTGTLPAGLDFNTTTGVISGTPTTVTASTSFTVTASDNDGASNTDAFTITVISAPFVTIGDREFKLRKQLYAKGNLKTTGNTVLVTPSGTVNCSTYINTGYINDTSNTNADYTFCGYHSDIVNVASHTSSSEASLDIPSTATILWAGLYWQSIVVDADYSDSMAIKFKKNGSSYQSIQPDVIDKRDYSNTYTQYSAYKDVTKILVDQGWKDGNYTVANMPIFEGKIDSLGDYGAWVLSVIYEDDSEKFRSFSVFDGWERIHNATKTIPIEGFYTPNRVLEATAAKVSVFVAEGDKRIAADVLKTKNYTAVGTPFVTLANVTNHTFRSEVNDVTSRTPNPSNNNGIDIHTYNIGTYLAPKQTNMDFYFVSGNDDGSQDAIFPSMIAVATELVTPELCYDYSFKQDGHYLKADNNGSQLPLLTGYISDSPLEVSIYLRNNEADIKAQGISFYTDVNSTIFDYRDGTVETSNINGSQYIPRTDTTGGCDYEDSATTPIGCNNGANIRIGLGDGATGYSQTGGGQLGDREFVYSRFELNPIGISGVSDVNQSLGLKLNYYIVPKTGASPIPYDYEFGTDIAMCPPSSGYTPVWGTFNVVDRNAQTISNLPANNLRTQVSRKPFYVDVAVYEKDTSTGKYTKVPTIDINTTVLAEIIDNDAFHDANASCANPGSAITEPIYVRISNTSTDMTIPIADQNASYHNFAVKNAAYRLWYFDQNQSSINWTATTPDATHLNLTSISGLYQSTYHTECVSECSTSTSVICFECIKANYAKPLCSRDNFAVRPESYDVRIYDIDQNATVTQKDATKVDLSDQFQYTPMYATATDRINLAAGYNYRYDMNATGNDTNLAKVPGYTRYFNGASSEYNATMIWEPSIGHVTTGCNDTVGKNLSFYVANGQMLNSEQNQTQVGEYRLNVIDPSWTAVDWYSTLTGHHTTSNGFELTKEDCITGSDSTSTLNGKVGCVTSSSHNGGGYTYKDHLLRLKPAKFDLASITYGIGMLPIGIAQGGEGYVYKSNLGIDNDMAMAVRAAGPIKAVGYGGEALSNFVKECFAVDLNMSISHDANISQPFIGRMTVAETNGTQIFDSLKFDATGMAQQVIEDTYFGKESNGQAVPTVRLNFDRNTTHTSDPQLVYYGDLNVSCNVASDCNMSAMSNSTPNIAEGSDLLDFNVTHVYGRVIPSNIRVMGGLVEFDALMKYEIYGSDSLLGQGLLQDASSPGWYVNRLHNEANDGNATVTIVYPTSGSQNWTTRVYDNNGTVTTHYPAFTIRQGYQGHVDTEGWLWYGDLSALNYSDPANPGNLNCLTHPCFNISFGRIIGNTGSAKTESEAHKANKNLSPGTGWQTTREYAPAAR